MFLFMHFKYFYPTSQNGSWDDLQGQYMNVNKNIVNFIIKVSNENNDIKMEKSALKTARL